MTEVLQSLNKKLDQRRAERTKPSLAVVAPIESRDQIRILNLRKGKVPSDPNSGGSLVIPGENGFTLLPGENLIDAAKITEPVQAALVEFIEAGWIKVSEVSQ